jgi:hypothetical protein
MGSNNSSSKFSKKKVIKKKTSKVIYPKILTDKENGLISIKLKNGIENRSYSKKGILFSENEDGEIIEIQILN